MDTISPLSGHYQQLVISCVRQTRHVIPRPALHNAVKMAEQRRNTNDKQTEVDQQVGPPICSWHRIYYHQGRFIHYPPPRRVVPPFVPNTILRTERPATSSLLRRPQDRRLPDSTHAKTAPCPPTSQPAQPDTPQARSAHRFYQPHLIVRDSAHSTPIAPCCSTACKAAIGHLSLPPTPAAAYKRHQPSANRLPTPSRQALALRLLRPERPLYSRVAWSAMSKSGTPSARLLRNLPRPHQLDQRPPLEQR